MDSWGERITREKYYENKYYQSHSKPLLEFKKELNDQKKAWTDAAPTRRMIELRRQRDVLLAETDWMANSDVTMSDAWKTYRQQLRDLPANTSDPANPTYPTKPST